MIINAPTNKMNKDLYRKKMGNTKKELLLSFESFVPNPTELKKMFQIVDEKERIAIVRLTKTGISRNRCFYSIDDILIALKQSKYVQESIAQGMWLFEFLHPPRGCDLNRFMTVEDTRIAGRILKYCI